MKVLVFSDAHGSKDLIQNIVQTHQDADYIISLGDTEVRFEFLQQYDIVAIKGNYPRDPGFAYEREMTLLGRSLFLTHGHKYGVHRSLVKLSNHAIENQYDIVLYGHTHIARIDRAGSSVLVNPGSIKSPRNALPPSYLIMTLNEQNVHFAFMESYNHQVFKEVEMNI